MAEQLYFIALDCTGVPNKEATSIMYLGYDMQLVTLTLMLISE